MEKSFPDKDQQLVANHVRTVLRKSFSKNLRSLDYYGGDVRCGSQSLWSCFSDNDLPLDLLTNSMKEILEQDIKKSLNIEPFEKLKRILKEKLSGIPSSELRMVFMMNEIDNYRKTAFQKFSTYSNINKNFVKWSNVVMEHFKKNQSLKQFDDFDGKCQLRTTRILSSLSEEQTNQIFWIVPFLHICFPEHDEDEETLQQQEQKLLQRIAIVLGEFRLKDEEIVNLVEELISDLQEEDYEYYQHLQSFQAVAKYHFLTWFQVSLIIDLFI